MSMEKHEHLLSTEIGRRSRRNFFAVSAAAAGVGALIMNSKLVAPAAAQTTTPAPTNPDIAALNYALRLERLEATFYTQGLQMYSSGDFASSQAAAVLGGSAAASLYGYLGSIRDHENQHVATLSSAVTTLGGTPQPAECYNFGYTSPDTFLLVAQALENTGVTAYDGAVAMIADPGLLQTAATIATVEARHASYLNLVVGSIPFPVPFDTAQTMAQILAIAGGFIATCTTPPGPITKAIAGPKNLTTSSQTVQLMGSSSTSVNSATLTFLWTRAITSNEATINDNHLPDPTVTFTGGPGVYIFNLRVTDSTGLNDTDTVIINYTGA